MASKQSDFLTLLDYSPEEIGSLLGEAARLKKHRAALASRPLEGKSSVLIFEKPSLRTRVSFETGIYELGGNAINMPANMVRIGSYF